MSLDPKQNRQDRERKKAVENKIPTLNPPFPFRVVVFDPWAFNLQKDSPKAGMATLDLLSPVSRQLSYWISHAPVMISCKEALRIFRRTYPRPHFNVVAVRDSLDENRCVVYGGFPENCWFVIFIERSSIRMLRSSNFVAVCKETGRIIKSGDLGNEG